MAQRILTLIITVWLAAPGLAVGQTSTTDRQRATVTSTTPLRTQQSTPTPQQLMLRLQALAQEMDALNQRHRMLREQAADLREQLASADYSNGTIQRDDLLARLAQVEQEMALVEEQKTELALETQRVRQTLARVQAKEAQQTVETQTSQQPIPQRSSISPRGD